LAELNTVKKAIADNEKRKATIGSVVIDLVDEVDQASEALEEAKRLAAQHLARGNEKPGLVRKAREALTEAQDRLDTARAADTQLKDDGELRTKLAVAEHNYEETLKSVVGNSPAMSKLIAEYEDAVRTVTRYKRAMDLVAEKGVLPLITYGIPPNDDQVDELAQQWKAAIAQLERNPDAELPS
jgi:hypothetical protein